MDLVSQLQLELVSHVHPRELLVQPDSRQQFLCLLKWQCKDNRIRGVASVRDVNAPTTVLFLGDCFDACPQLNVPAVRFNQSRCGLVELTQRNRWNPQPDRKS